MEELLNKPILKQMYDFRKEKFEQTVYDNNKEIKEIETKVTNSSEQFIDFLKKVIPNQKNFEKVKEMYEKNQLLYSEEIYFWSLEYFKLGMTEKEKIRNEFFKKKDKSEQNDTFIDFEENGLLEYIEEQKKKYNFCNEEYKELQNQYIKIGEKYPNAIKVFEGTKLDNLNKEEIEALIKLKNIDILFRYMETVFCFKLGMKEVIEFR